MSSYRPFRVTAWLAAPAVAALMLLAPASVWPAKAQTAQATPAAAAPAIEAAPTRSLQATTNVDSQAASSEQRSLTAKAIDRVKQVARSAGDIFNRVPCLPPKGGAKSMGTLPRVANRLVAGQPVVIIAF